jgi:RNA polymerase I-specific transcription initiation factor RRN7
MATTRSLRGMLVEQCLCRHKLTLQTIVRELWAYQLATAQTSSPPFASASNQLNPSAITGASGEVPVSEAAPDGKEDDKGDSSDSDEDGFRTEKEEDALDPEILAELSDLSDQSEDEGSAEQARQDGERGPKWKRRRQLRATDTLVTLIMGCWILRVPVMNVDVEG